MGALSVKIQMAACLSLLAYTVGPCLLPVSETGQESPFSICSSILQHHFTYLFLDFWEVEVVTDIKPSSHRNVCAMAAEHPVE